MAIEFSFWSLYNLSFPVLRAVSKLECFGSIASSPRDPGATTIVAVPEYIYFSYVTTSTVNYSGMGDPPDYSDFISFAFANTSSIVPTI